MAERAIRIEADGVRLYAILESTATADAVWEALPITGKASLQAGEIRVPVGIRLEPEPGAGTTAGAGSLAFRPDLPAIALVFQDAAAVGKPDPGARPLNVFGRITGDASRLTRIAEGARVKLTALEG